MIKDTVELLRIQKRLYERKGAEETERGHCEVERPEQRWSQISSEDDSSLTG